MSQTLQHQVKPSTDVSLPVQSEPQLQRRAFPHEVESQTDKAIAPPTPISADWQAQQEKMARARFNPGMISLYPANPLKDEKEKPVQRKVDSIVESDETQTKPIQRRVESPPEADEGQAESIQRKTESTAQDELEKDKPSSNKLVQTKLRVGKVGDRYEQEADQVAAKVMTMPDPSRNRIQRQPEQPESEIQPKPLAITPLVQRQASDEEVQTKATQEKQSQPDDTFEARLSGSMAGGSPLPEDVRAFMEPRLGASLKHVRAHTDFNATQMNKELGAQAFTYRNHIFYAAGKAPAKDELTAHELTHVIQQTGAKSLHPSAVGVPTRNTLQAKISRVSNPEEVQPKRAPASAKSDPAFQSVVTNTKAIAVEKKQHPPAQQKVTEVHAAAKPPSNDVESKAQDKQVQAMNQQQPGEFNAKAFQAALKQKIADVAPNTMQETEDFKNQNKVEEVKQDIASQVGNEKQQAAGPIEQKTQEAPNPKGITPKSVTPLPRKKLGKAGRVAAKGAAPKRKDESEVSLEAGSQQLDQQMSSAKVTEEQLKKSNEPKFQDAANAKKTAQTDAAKAPDQYRQREQGVVAGAEMQAQMTTSKDLDAMHTTQDRHVTQVLGKQGDAKGKDEQKRSHVSDHIQGIYNRTKQKVETILNQLDQDANHTFDQGATRAQNEFNDYVDRQMRMYKIRRYLSHPGGAFLWAKDKLLGLPDEVNVFYEQGRTRYLTSMDRAIAQVSNLVANRLKAAKAEITGGKKEIQTYVAGLEPSLRQVGQEAAKNIQSQFDDLEQSVNDKQNQLIESLAQKYNDNLKTLDDRINQMKDANKGLVQKAMDKVRDTINTIRDLTNMMMGVLRRAAGVIQLIIKDPIAFLTNLISGLKQGFLNFKANIGKHLQQGLMGFLTGTMGGTITMPSSFDPKGIFSLVTQVLGVTYASIRSKATGKWGEKKVGHLETSFDVFKTLKREGVGGLWNQIKGQIGDLKSLVLDGIRNFLIEKVVVAGVLWIISLFNPATAFIRACKAIVDIIRFFIERGSQIMELMNAVMDAIVAIAQGSLGAAAKLVESAMAKALPVVLGFIASLLGIGGLTKKVQDIIQKVRKPIDKGIDQVFGKADKFIKTLGGKAKDSKLGQKAISAQDVAKRKKEEAQKWAEEKKEAGKRAIEQQKDKLKQKITANKDKFANSKVGQKLAAVDRWTKQKINGVKNKWDKAKKLPGKKLNTLKNKFNQSKLGQKLGNKWNNLKDRFSDSKIGRALGFGQKNNKDRKLRDKEIGKTINFSAQGESHRLWIQAKGLSTIVMVASNPGPVETKINDWQNQLARNNDRVPEEKRSEAEKLLGIARERLGITEQSAEITLDEINEAEQNGTSREVAEARQADNQTEREEESLAKVLEKLFLLFGENNNLNHPVYEKIGTKICERRNTENLPDKAIPDGAKEPCDDYHYRWQNNTMKIWTNPGQKGRVPEVHIDEKGFLREGPNPNANQGNDYAHLNREDIRTALQKAANKADSELGFAKWMAVFATGGTQLRRKAPEPAEGDYPLTMRKVWQENGFTDAEVVREISVAINQTINKHPGFREKKHPKFQVKYLNENQQGFYAFRLALVLVRSIGDKELYYVKHTDIPRNLVPEPHLIPNPTVLSLRQMKYTAIAKHSKNVALSELDGQIHHVVPLYLGGGSEEGNLVAAEGQRAVEKTAHNIMHTFIDELRIKKTLRARNDYHLEYNSISAAFPENALKIIIGTVLTKGDITYQETELSYKENSSSNTTPN